MGGTGRNFRGRHVKNQLEEAWKLEMVMTHRCLDVCLVLLWVWVQPASLATAETSWQHEMLQGADASRSACFLQCHH